MFDRARFGNRSRTRWGIRKLTRNGVGKVGRGTKEPRLRQRKGKLPDLPCKNNQVTAAWSYPVAVLHGRNKCVGVAILIPSDKKLSAVEPIQAYTVSHAAESPRSSGSCYPRRCLANFTYGNSGANILREDRFKNLDLSLFKQFQFNERVRPQFRAEAFNLTNTASFSAPGTNIDTASGGLVTSTISAPRNVQFGLKLNF